MAATSPPRTAPDAYTAYEAMAPVYDPFTSHHRYELWTDMVERLLRPHGLAERGRLLDVGCGTGRSFQPWEARGWSVLACDASPGMLEQAAAKAGPATATVLGDARDLPELGSFDLVTMIDDVVNYLAPHEHAATFAGVRRNLAPHGLLAFDLNTVGTYRTFFAETDVRDADGCFVVWRGQASPAFAPGDTADAVLDAFVEDEHGGWERRRSVHRQHHHPAADVATSLREAGLRVCAVHGTDDDCNAYPRLDELRHSKALVIATHARP